MGRAGDGRVNISNQIENDAGGMLPVLSRSRGATLVVPFNDVRSGAGLTIARASEGPSSTSPGLSSFE